MDHLQPYLPILLIFVLGAGFGIVGTVAGRLLGPKRYNPDKFIPYESGIVPFGDANVRVPIKFYMVALLFLLFDVEAIYLLAWAVIFQGNALDWSSGAYGFTQAQFQIFAFFEMAFFIAVLMVGFAYVWRKGGLEWS